MFGDSEIYELGLITVKIDNIPIKQIGLKQDLSQQVGKNVDSGLFSVEGLRNLRLMDPFVHFALGIRFHEEHDEGVSKDYIISPAFLLLYIPRYIPLPPARITKPSSWPYRTSRQASSLSVLVPRAIIVTISLPCGVEVFRFTFRFTS